MASLTTKQIQELDIASARKAAGNASSTDLANISYAEKTYGYKYTPAATSQVQTQVKTETSLPVASASPTSTKTGTNTLLAYDVNNNNAPVYVTPGKYYEGISLTPDYSKVNNMADANKAINGAQNEDMSAAGASGAPEEKKSYTELNDLLNNIIGQNTTKSSDQTNLETIKNAVTPETEKPTQVNMADTYTQLRDTYGVTGLETQLNDLNAQKQDLLATKQSRIYAERNKAGVAQNVVEGRISKVEQQENERIALLDNEISNVTNQLNTKYSVISNIMQYKGVDYNNAVTAYDNELANNLSIFNTLRGMSEADKNDQQRQEDNARASLQIIYNSIMNGGSNLEDLPADTKTLINKLEVQAGLPSGFYASLQSKNAKSEIVATYNWTGSDGKEYASVLSKDPTTGQIKTNNIVLGNAKASTGSTEKATDAEIKVWYKQNMTSALSKVVGTDGKVSPESWNKARQEWASNSPYTTADFDEAFKGFIDPTHPQDYAGYENYKSGFIKKSSAELEAGE